LTRNANWTFYKPPSLEYQEMLTPLVAVINTLQEHSRYWEVGALIHLLTTRAPSHSLTKPKDKAAICHLQRRLGEGTLLGAPHGQGVNIGETKE
jgi:hypothetical protein